MIDRFVPRRRVKISSRAARRAAHAGGCRLFRSRASRALRPYPKGSPGFSGLLSRPTDWRITHSRRVASSRLAFNAHLHKQRSILFGAKPFTFINSIYGNLRLFAPRPHTYSSRTTVHFPPSRSLHIPMYAFVRFVARSRRVENARRKHGSLRAFGFLSTRQ